MELWLPCWEATLVLLPLGQAAELKENETKDSSSGPPLAEGVVHSPPPGKEQILSPLGHSVSGIEAFLGSLALT